jgi:hypothetical protein
MGFMSGVLCGLDIIRSIVDLLEDESSIKDLVDIFSYFVL